MAEIICLILVLNFFYEGIYKIAHLHKYAQWLNCVKILKFTPTIFSWIIPGIELITAVLLLIPITRIKGLVITLYLLLLFTSWIIISFYSASLTIWPFHPLWPSVNWMGRLETSILFGWISLIAIFLTNTNFNSKNLRNMPAKSS